MHLIPRSPFEDQYAMSYGFSIAPPREGRPKGRRERIVRLPGHLRSSPESARSSSRARVPSTATTKRMGREEAAETTEAPSTISTQITSTTEPPPSSTMMAASMETAKYLGGEFEVTRPAEEKEKEQTDQVRLEIASEKTQAKVGSSEVLVWTDYSHTYQGESSRDAQLRKERYGTFSTEVYRKGNHTVKEEELDILEWRFQRDKMKAEKKEKRTVELHRQQYEMMEEIEREKREIERDRQAALRKARDGKKKEEGTGRCLVVDEPLIQREAKVVDRAAELGKEGDGKKQGEPCACQPSQAATPSQVDVGEIEMGYRDGTIKAETSAHEANRLKEEERLKRAKHLREQAYWARRWHEQEMQMFLYQQEEMLRNGTSEDEEHMRIWWEDIMQELKKVEHAEALAANGGLSSQDHLTVRSEKSSRRN